MNTVFQERLLNLSPFVLFSTSDDSEEMQESLQLSYVRVEFQRMRPGMQDYIIRVSSPKYSNVEKSNTVLSIRGNRGLTKYERLKVLATTVKEQMVERGDATFDWKNLDVEHLTDMLVSPVKYFSMNTNLTLMRFTTEALMVETTKAGVGDTGD